MDWIYLLRSTTRRIIRSLIQGVVICAITLLSMAFAAEVLLRLVAPHRTLGTLIEKDPLVGYRHHANARTHYYMDGRYVSIRTNSLGLRQDEEFGPKGANEFRVLVLGDSCTFGWGTESENSFFQLFSKNARERFANHHVTFLNAGHGAYGTKQMLAYLEEYGFDFDPDYVLMVMGYNDIDDNERNSHYYYLDDRGRAIRDRRPAPYSYEGTFTKLIPGYDWLMFNSYLVQMSRGVGRQLVSRLKGLSRSGKIKTTKRPVRQAKHVALSSMHRPSWDNTTQLTRALLIRLRDQIRKRGLEVSVTTVGYGTPKTTRFWQTHRRWFEKNGIDFFDVASEFEKERLQNGSSYFLSDSHFSEKGSVAYVKRAWPHLEKRLAKYLNQRGNRQYRYLAREWDLKPDYLGMSQVRPRKVAQPSVSRKIANP